MSLLSESGIDDQRLVRYLLGLLSEEEVERLDELSIADDEIASRLQVAEDELVDAYVAGTLAGDTLERFESHYLASPRRREKVSFAASLRAVGARAPVPADKGGGSADARFPPGTAAPRADPPPAPSARVIRFPRALWMLAAAASLLLAITGTLVFQEFQLRRGLSEAQAASAARGRRASELERQLVEQRAAGAEAARELERVRGQIAARVERPGAAGPGDRATAASQALCAIALALLPQTRAVGPIAVLALAPGTRQVTFELRLESSPLPRYQVAVKDPGTGLIVWRSGPVSPSAGEPAAVSVTVPARVLKPQHYALDLVGQGADGTRQVVGSYAVQVVGG
jgi:hypothetical protein